MLFFFEGGVGLGSRCFLSLPSLQFLSGKLVFKPIFNAWRPPVLN